MKKSILIAGLSLAALSFVSCQKEEVRSESSVSEPNFTLFAQTADTRTSNDGLNTKWVAEDAINVFHAVKDATTYTSDGKFTVSDVETGKFAGNVSGTLSEESYDWYALYPYTAKITTPKNTSSGYVTVGGKTQKQNGNNSKAHLCGTVCPLYGIAKDVSASESPAITMNQLTSVVKVKVTNKSGDNLTVNSVVFTGTEDIAGTYYIDFVSSPVVYKSSGSTYVSSTATLTVSNGDAIENGSSAEFYIAIKPFTAASGKELKLSVNGYEKKISLTDDINFTAGHIKTLNFNYDTTKKGVTYDFTDPESLGLIKPSVSKSTDITSDIIKEDITMSATNGSTNTRIFNKSGNCELRIYNGGTLKFVVADGYVIEEISFTGSSTILSASTGTYADGVWVGQNKEVTFTASATQNIKTVVVSYDKGQAETSISASDVMGVSARGVDSAVLEYVLENPISGTTMTVECDGEIVTEAVETEGNVMYTVSMNTTGKARDGWVSLTYGTIVKKIKVSQIAHKFYVSDTEIVLEADASAEGSFVITSDFDWYAESSTGAGFTYTPSTYEWVDGGKETITVTASAANTSETGIISLGTITLTNMETSETKDVTIYQKSSYVAPVTGTTVTKTISEIVTANNYEISSGNTVKTKKISLAIDDVITISSTGGGNTGSFWTNSTTNVTDWRSYQNGSDSAITIAAADGYVIEKLKLTFTVGNEGTLSNGDKKILSDTEYSINAQSISYVIGHSSGKKNGQIRISAISVTYTTK